MKKFLIGIVQRTHGRDTETNRLAQAYAVLNAYYQAQGFDAVTAQNNDKQWSIMFHRKRILTQHLAGCYRSSCQIPAANTEWRIAA